MKYINFHRIVSVTALLLTVSLIWCVWWPIPTVSAAGTGSLGGMAQPIPKDQLSTEIVPNGTIVSFKEGKYSLLQEPYDKNVFGVTVTNPALQLTYEGEDADNTVPVMSSGQADVRVTTVNGDIKRGDRITSSAQAGVGMKATKSGFSLGIADADYTSSDPNDEGLIPVTLQIQFTFAADTPASEKISSRLVDLISLSSLAAIENPITALQYTTSALIILGTLLFSFLTFGRVARESVLSLGRNPLASRAITLGLIWNTLLALSVIAVGAGIAYFIVAL